MKTKLLVLLLIVAIFTTVLCSCEVLKFANHVLDFVPKPDNNKDTNININIGGTTAHVHTEVVIPAVESTCTATGLSEGKKCKDCGEIIVPQVEVSLKAHTYDNSVDKYCNVCEHERDIDCSHEGTTEFLPAKESTCTEAGLTQGVRCTLCGEIVVAQQSLPLKDHVSSDWIVDYEATTEKEGLRHIECTICGTVTHQETIPMIIPSSEGLEYKLNKDGKSYSVIGIGDFTADHLVIPDTYEGKPVTTIGQSAFSKCEFIKSVTIPDSITGMGMWAFSSCYALETVIIGNGLTMIPTYAFSRCKSLVNLSIGNNVWSIGQVAFELCTSLVNLHIPDSVTTINDASFYMCTSLENVTLGNKVKYIDSRAFYECTSLTTINIPNSVTSVGINAFYGCKSLTIYCEPLSQPDGWNPQWNPNNCPVVWGYTGN